MMELYGFGFNGSRQIQAQDAPELDTPTLMRRAPHIKLLWASWCDVLIAMQDDDGTWAVEYLGSGLTSLQKEHLEECESVKLGLDEHVAAVDFFGTKMHDGLRGYVIHSCRGCMDNQVIMFATEKEMDEGIPEIQTYIVHDDLTIGGVEIMGNGTVLVSTSVELTKEAKVVLFNNIIEFRQHLSIKSWFVTDLPVQSFESYKVSSNSTTATALDHKSRVHTFTVDPRYPQCLGRPYESSKDFEIVPFLSETRISSISSGGYMTAAVSSDSELFLWGQACPQAGGELAVLKQNTVSGTEAEEPISSIDTEDEQEDFVKCLTVRIEREEASVHGIAVGHGHVLVAASSRGLVCDRKHVVLAAGDSRKGQLGFPTKHFVTDFKELVAMRSKRVVQMLAAGWTSFIVTYEQ